jgi:predicted DNA-binding protein
MSTSREAAGLQPQQSVTKSIRLTAEEADDLAQLVAGTAYAEAALLRQWVLAGMQQFRIAEAIRLYQDGHVDIHQAAVRARLPVAILLDEMAARKVAILDQPDAFGPGLEALRGALGAGPEEGKRATAVASHL